MSKRLSAEQLRDVQELPATSAGNVLMRATMRNALLAHISVLEAQLQEAREQIARLRRHSEWQASYGDVHPGDKQFNAGEGE